MPPTASPERTGHPPPAPKPAGMATGSRLAKPPVRPTLRGRSHGPEGRAAPLPLPRGQAYLIAGAVGLVTAIMIGKLVTGDLKDAIVWYDTGRRVLSGAPLATMNDYRYPPTFAVLVAPLCALGLAGFFLTWYVANLVLFGLSIRLAAENMLARLDLRRPHPALPAAG